MREAGERHGRVAGPSCGLFAVFGGMGGTASPNRTLISPGRPAGGSGAGLEGKGASGSAVWGAKLGPDAAILIMTEFSLLREAPALKPPKATAKPYTRHILGIDSGLQSHLKATLRPPHSHTKATPKPTTQAISMAGGRGNRLFSQGLGHNENCCHAAGNTPHSHPLSGVLDTANWHGVATMLVP